MGYTHIPVSHVDETFLSVVRVGTLRSLPALATLEDRHNLIVR